MLKIDNPILTDIGTRTLNSGLINTQTNSKVTDGNTDDEKLKKVCKEMESLFIDMLFKEMRKTVDKKDSLIPDSNAQQMFESMYDSETAKNLSQKGGIGLADMLYKQLRIEQKQSAAVNAVNAKG